MNNITKCLGFALLITIISCHSSIKNDSMGIAATDMVAPISVQEQNVNVEQTTQIKQIERKLIKEGRVEFETKSLQSTRKTVFEAVNKNKGYISSDQEFKSEGRISNTIVIRVPASNFDNLLSDATKGVKKFEDKEISVKDITEEFLDIQARLKTKKELEARYLELLKRANKISEVLAIEGEIGKLRADIESVEGRLKYLENQVSLSTLTMTFYESVPHQTEFGRKFNNGFKNGWDNLVWFFVLLTHIWPFIVIAIGVLTGLKFYNKKRNKS